MIQEQLTTTAPLLWRYATKKYDPTKKINDQDLQKLLEAIHYAPSSYGLQPFKVLVVESEELRQQLRAHSWNQPQTTDASHFLVFVAKNDIEHVYVDEFVQRTAQTRGLEVEQLGAYGDFMKSKIGELTQEQIATWNAKQAYIAMGFLLFQAALLEIDATPMEGLDAKAYNEILKLDDHHTAFAVALGYRAEDDSLQHAAKVRKPFDEIIEKI